MRHLPSCFRGRLPFTLVFLIAGSCPCLQAQTTKQAATPANETGNRARPLAAAAAGLNLDEELQREQQQKEEAARFQAEIQKLLSQAASTDPAAQQAARETLRSLGTKAVGPLLMLPMANPAELDPLRREMLLLTLTGKPDTASAKKYLKPDKVVELVRPQGARAVKTFDLFLKSLDFDASDRHQYVELLRALLEATPDPKTEESILLELDKRLTEVTKQFWTAFNQKTDPRALQPGDTQTALVDVCSLGPIHNSMIAFDLVALEASSAKAGKKLDAQKERLREQLVRHPTRRRAIADAIGAFDPFADVERESTDRSQHEAGMCLRPLQHHRQQEIRMTLKRLGLAEPPGVPRRPSLGDFACLRKISDHYWAANRYAMAALYDSAALVRLMEDQPDIPNLMQTNCRMVALLYAVDRKELAKQILDNGIASVGAFPGEVRVDPINEPLMAKGMYEQQYGLLLRHTSPRQEVDQHYSPGVEMVIDACSSKPELVVPNYLFLANLWNSVNEPELALIAISYAKDSLAALKETHPRLAVDVYLLVMDAGIRFKGAQRVVAYADQALGIITAAKLGPELAGKVHGFRGVALREIGQLDAADAAFSAAQQSYRDCKTPPLLELARLDHELGSLRLQQNRSAEARVFLQSARLVRARELGASHPVTESTVALLKDAR